MQGADEEDGEWDQTEKDFCSVSPALDALSALTIKEQKKDVFSTPPQLDGDLITLTFLPRARWQTLLHLDVIAVCLPSP